VCKSVCAPKLKNMYSYSNNGITVASILDDRRQMNDRTYPVKIRVTYQRERKYYTTGKGISVGDWEKLAETKSKKLMAIRTDIQYSFDKVKKAVMALERDDNFSFSALNNFLGKSSADTLNAAFQLKMSLLLSNEQINSYHYYSDTLKSLEIFAGKHIPVTAINVDWLQKYEKHLYGWK